MRQSDEPSAYLTISDSQYRLHIKTYKVLEWLNLCKIVCGDTSQNMQIFEHCQILIIVHFE